MKMDCVLRGIRRFHADHLVSFVERHVRHPLGFLDPGIPDHGARGALADETAGPKYDRTVHYIPSLQQSTARQSRRERGIRPRWEGPRQIREACAAGGQAAEHGRSPSFSSYFRINTVFDQTSRLAAIASILLGLSRTTEAAPCAPFCTDRSPKFCRGSSAGCRLDGPTGPRRSVGLV